jgi:hypothetical protein
LPAGFSLDLGAFHLLLNGHQEREFMTTHPRFTALADLADGTAAVTTAKARHVTECASCTTVVEKLRDVMGVLRAGAASEPPAAWLRRAVRIPAAARRAMALEGVREFLARLVYDSLAAPAPAHAMRGAAVRHVLFSAGPFELDLRRDGDTLRGTLVPEGDAAPPAGFRVRLVRVARTVAEARTDARGRFTLRAPRSRAAAPDLVIEGEGVRIRVRSLDL